MAKKFVVSLRTVITLLTLWALTIILSVGLYVQVNAKDLEDSYKDFELFSRVIAMVQKNYYKEVDTKDLIKGAVKGMLLSLDPHSSYLDEEFYKDLQEDTKGKFGGLGIEITIKNGLLTVVSPIEDSPAARAGIQPGDQIIKIEEDLARNLNLTEAVKKMRGPRGTPINISVHRPGKDSLIPFKIVRDIIKVRSVRSRMLDDGYGYVRLAQFQEGSSKELKNAINKLAKKTKDGELKGLVLDLRFNPGGLLTEAVKVADLFLKDGLLVKTEGRLDSQRQAYYAHDDKNEIEAPIVVLVNGGSASASEIIAASLKDHEKAIVLGTQTFGKGSVQTVLPVDSSDGALRLTTALYYTRSGVAIQEKGVTPDIVVEQENFTLEEGELMEDKNQILDPSKTNIKDIKNSQTSLLPGSREAMNAELVDLLKVDKQIDEALRLLKLGRVITKDKLISDSNKG